MKLLECKYALKCHMLWWQFPWTGSPTLTASVPPTQIYVRGRRLFNVAGFEPHVMGRPLCSLLNRRFLENEGLGLP